MSKSLPFFYALMSLGAVSLCADEADLAMNNENSLVAYGQKNNNTKTHVQNQKTCNAMTAFSSCPDHWRISGDYLYLLPSISDTYFVTDSPIETAMDVIPSYPNGKRKNNDFNFSSGFRIGAEFAMCKGQRELEAYYTYLSTHKHRKVVGDFLWAAAGPMRKIARPADQSDRSIR